MKNNKYQTYIWSCELNNYSGEGKLSYLFLKNLLKKEKLRSYIIETPFFFYTEKNINKINKSAKYKSNFYYKYCTPFLGLFKIIINHYIFKKKTVYINYLPIWNFLLLLFIPRKTILGPITGSDFFNNINFKNLYRFIVLKNLNFISKLILGVKYKNLIFSTNLINYSKEGNEKLYQLQYFRHKKRRKKIKKEIYLVFYYRNHPNKYSKYEISFLKKLIKSGKKIIIVGDKLLGFEKVCVGHVNQSRLTKILDRSSFTISSLENPFSFFVQDAILSNVTVIFHSQQKKYISKYFKYYYLIDFSKKNFLPLKKTKKLTDIIY